MKGAVIAFGALAGLAWMFAEKAAPPPKVLEARAGEDWTFVVILEGLQDKGTSFLRELAISYVQNMASVARVEKLRARFQDTDGPPYVAEIYARFHFDRDGVRPLEVGSRMQFGPLSMTLVEATRADVVPNDTIDLLAAPEGTRAA